MATAMGLSLILCLLLIRHQTDIIAVLDVIAGLEPAGINLNADVNGDGKDRAGRDDLYSAKSSSLQIKMG